MIKVVPVKEDGVVVLTKEELEEMLNQAFEEGKIEGRKYIYTPITYPTTNPNPDWGKITYGDKTYPSIPTIGDFPKTTGTPYHDITYTISNNDGPKTVKSLYTGDSDIQFVNSSIVDCVNRDPNVTITCQG